MITKKTLITLGVACLIIGMGFATSQYLLRSAPQAEKQKRPQSGTIVETASFSPTSKAITLSLIGTVEAAQKTTLSSKVAGKIIQTHPNFMLGSVVKKGELLAQIDPVDYQAALDQITAQLLSAKANETIEMGQQESAKEELKLSNLSPSPLNRSLMLREPQLAQVRASIAQLEASYTTARNNLKETRIQAPYDGVIVSKSAELGAYVSAQSSIVELVATDTFWIRTTLPREYLKFLDTADTKALSAINVTLLSNKHPLHVKARILKLLPELDSTTKQATLLIGIEDPLGLMHKEARQKPILLGDTLEVILQTKTYDSIIALPSSMLRSNNTIWVMSKENTLEIKSVDIVFKNAHEVLVQQGINPDDKIISTYLSAPISGMKVIDMASAKNRGK